MDWLREIVEQIELHSPGGIRHCFAKGINPNMHYRGKPLFWELISEYTRSNRFSACVEAFADAGFVVEDAALFAVFRNHVPSLEACISLAPACVNNTYSFKAAYTPMLGASLLHICAEFNHVACAEVLQENGADINAKAGVDENGFGGQTPLFHTVNQNNNQSLDMLHFLLDHGADTGLTVRGLTWGEGYSWETFIPAVNPLSYTMMGLLPQMHRDPKVIAAIVSLLLEKTYGIQYTVPNIPNAYLKL